MAELQLFYLFADCAPKDPNIVLPPKRLHRNNMSNLKCALWLHNGLEDYIRQNCDVTLFIENAGESKQTVMDRVINEFMPARAAKFFVAAGIFPSSVLKGYNTRLLNDMNSTMKTARILPVDNWFFRVIAKVDKESWTMTAPLSYLKSNVKQSFGTFSSTAYPLPTPRDVDVTFREALEAEGETLMSWEEWKELNQVWFAKHGIDLDKRAEGSHSDVSESPDPQEEGEEGYAGEDDSQATEEATASYAPGTPSNNEQPKRQLSGGSKHESPPKRLLSKDAIVIEDDAAPETQPAVNLRAKIHSLARSLVDDVTVPPHELPKMQSQPPGSLLPKGNAPSPSQRAELPSQAGAEAPSLPQAQDQPMASQPHGRRPQTAPPVAPATPFSLLAMHPRRVQVPRDGQNQSRSGGTQQPSMPVQNNYLPSTVPQTPTTVPQSQANQLANAHLQPRIHQASPHQSLRPYQSGAYQPQQPTRVPLVPPGFNVPTNPAGILKLQQFHMHTMSQAIQTFENGCVLVREDGGYECKIILTKKAG